MTSNYPFVAKLYAMLTDNENSAFISWSPDGGAFFVWNPTEFSSTVLPKYFKHNNFCSFVRQLNIYGFHKVENENWMFTHDEKLFQRDTPELIAKIQRRRQTKRSGGSHLDDVDDFLTHQPTTKRVKSEEPFTAPMSAPVNPSATNHHHHHHMMAPPSMVSMATTTPRTPHTPATPAGGFLMTPGSVGSTSNSHSSTVSTLEEDVAYLKTMNNALAAEIGQMKRKTQSQEDTIAWLIQELARTQRHVELMSQQQQHQQPQQQLTPSNSLPTHMHQLPSQHISSHKLKLEGMNMDSSSSNGAMLASTNSNNLPTFLPTTPASTTATTPNNVYTPQSTSSTASFSFDRASLSNSTNGFSGADFGDYSLPDEGYPIYNPEDAAIM